MLDAVGLPLVDVAGVVQVVQLGSRVKELEKNDAGASGPAAAAPDSALLRHQLGYAVQLLRRYQTAASRPTQAGAPSCTPNNEEIQCFIAACFAMGVSSGDHKPDACATATQQYAVPTNSTDPGETAVPENIVVGNGSKAAADQEAGNPCNQQDCMPQVLLHTLSLPLARATANLPSYFRSHIFGMH